MTSVLKSGLFHRWQLTTKGDRYEHRQVPTDGTSAGIFLVRGGVEKPVPRGGWLFEDGTAVYDAKPFEAFVRDRAGVELPIPRPNDRCVLRSVSATGHLVWLEERDYAWNTVAIHIGFDWGRDWLVIPNPERVVPQGLINANGLLLTELEGEGPVLLSVAPGGITAKSVLPNGLYWGLNDVDLAVGGVHTPQPVGPVLVAGGQVHALMPQIHGAAGWSSLSIHGVAENGMMAGVGMHGSAHRPFRLRPRAKLPKGKTLWAELPDVRVQLTRTGIVITIHNVKIRLPTGAIIKIPVIVIGPGRPPVWGPEAMLGKKVLGELMAELAPEMSHPLARQVLADFAAACAADLRARPKTRPKKAAPTPPRKPRKR
jgi:hypothetical protein